MITAADREQLTAAIERIATVPGASVLDGQDILQRTAATAAAEISTLLGVKACAYRVKPRQGGWDFESMALAGAGWPQDITPHFKTLLEDRTEFWGLYDPLRPAANQRNVVVSHDPTSKGAVPKAFYVSVGLAGCLEMRMLVCDGPMLLSWLGCWKDRPFDARDAWFLRRVGCAAKRAFRMSRALPSGVAWSGFEAALDALEIDAFVVRKTGQIDYANRVGAERLQADRATVAQELAASLGPQSKMPPFDLHPLRLRGSPALFLAMRSVAPGRALERRSVQIS